MGSIAQKTQFLMCYGTKTPLRSLPVTVNVTFTHRRPLVRSNQPLVQRKIPFNAHNMPPEMSAVTPTTAGITNAHLAHSGIRCIQDSLLVLMFIPGCFPASYSDFGGSCAGSQSFRVSFCWIFALRPLKSTIDEVLLNKENPA